MRARTSNSGVTMDKVIEITARRLDKWGSPTTGKAKGNKVRISVYIDYEEDNHHVQFPEGAHRGEVADALRDLSDRVRGKA